MDGLVGGDRVSALDVGAGTGIASTQLIEAGAQVVAVEPDARMARMATARGIRVEQAKFEDWQPADRSFDLVVFASSFHWMQPRPALEKIATLLRPHGRLVLLGNRIVPVSPPRAELDAIHGEYVDVTRRSSMTEDDATALLEEFGYRVERRRMTEAVHYATDDYLGLTFTYSNRSVLDPKTRAELRSRLAHHIGPAGVDAEADATALVCTR